MVPYRTLTEAEFPPFVARARRVLSRRPGGPADERLYRDHCQALVAQAAGAAGAFLRACRLRCGLHPALFARKLRLAFRHYFAMERGALIPPLDVLTAALDLVEGSRPRPGAGLALPRQAPEDSRREAI